MKNLSSKYKNVNMKQDKKVILSFDKFFGWERFDTVIEIGTLPGGFALYLQDMSKEYKFDFYTFDIRIPTSIILKKFIDNRIKFINEDAMTSEFLIESVVNENNRVLILNDGGLKVPVFKKIIRFMKKKDMILTHDYHCDLKQSCLGNIVIDDIIDDLKDAHMICCYHDLFDKYLWLCCEKR